MRAGIGCVLALAAAVAGCKALGFQEETTKDLSSMNTKAGTVLDLDLPHKVQVVKFEMDFKSNPAKATVTLKNDGPFEDLFSFDVEFGFPAPAESFAPYNPDFVGLDIAEFKAGEERKVVIQASPGHKDAALFARVVTSKGSDVTMTAPRESSRWGLRVGTKLLGNRVEVVKLDANLTPKEGEKPHLSFTLESQDDKAEIGTIKYMVQFYSQKDEKLMDLGRRFYSLKPVGSPLGKKGSQVTVDVAGLESITGLAGAKPVLRVTQ